MNEPTAGDIAKAREIRLAIEKSGRYGPIDAVDPHDGSVQREVESIIAEAIARRVNPLVEAVELLPDHDPRLKDETYVMVRNGDLKILKAALQEVQDG